MMVSLYHYHLFGSAFDYFLILPMLCWRALTCSMGPRERKLTPKLVIRPRSFNLPELKPPKSILVSLLLPLPALHSHSSMHTVPLLAHALSQGTGTSVHCHSWLPRVRPQLYWGSVPNNAQRFTGFSWLMV